jgi:crotonobetainyl-CoA:carnitine CoA-transferase CaiB-like acyl-CoA transferase
MLTPYRVLDLSDHRGAMAGNILGSLGAEIVLVEGPGGRGRDRAPLSPDGTSLDWWALRRGAKSVVVHNRDELLELVSEADVLVESPDPGLGLDHRELEAANPSLIHATITPFGRSGPKAGWAATDLTIAAASCQAAITGDSDRAPIRITVPQAWHHAGGQAATAIALALAERRVSGLGQHIDVSAQQALMQTAFPGVVFAPNDYPVVQRTSGGILMLNFHLQFVYPAADGHVSVTLLFGDTIGRFTARLMAWIQEAGFCGPELGELDWVEFGMRLITEPDVAPAQMEAAKAAITAFTSTRTRAELFAEAQRREVLLAPVFTPGELVDMEHLGKRGFWCRENDPTLGAVVTPGDWVQPSSGALPQRGLPPRLGAHTDELSGPAAEAVDDGTARPIVPVAPTGVSRLPLEGLKVVDTTWVYAGPFTTRVLADFGATVIKVEGPNRFDASRGGGGALNGDLGPDASIQFGTLNAGKLGLTLDLNVEEGRAVMRDLVEWADVLVESYTPGTMEGWGLGYDTLRAINPRLVMLSTSLMGQSGPLSTFAGFGNLAGAITGFYEVTGWPDRSPAGPFLAYTDYVVPNFMVPLIVAALEQRERDGEGQHLDFAQAEAAIHFLTSAVLEHTVNGVGRSRMGNADPFFAPHGVYRAAGDDTWVAVACETDRQWQSLAGVLERLDLGDVPVAERLERSTELDGLITAYTSTRDPAAIEEELQSVGVPVHRVQNSDGCLVDPQLRHVGHWLTVEHPLHESMVIEAPRFRLSRTPHQVTRSGPLLGEHNDHVLREVLGYDDERVIELAIAGAIG